MSANEPKIKLATREVGRFYERHLSLALSPILQMAEGENHSAKRLATELRHSVWAQQRRIAQVGKPENLALAYASNPSIIGISTCCGSQTRAPEPWQQVVTSRQNICGALPRRRYDEGGADSLQR